MQKFRVLILFNTVLGKRTILFFQECFTVKFALIIGRILQYSNMSGKNGKVCFAWVIHLNSYHRRAQTLTSDFKQNFLSALVPTMPIMLVVPVQKRN